MCSVSGIGGFLGGKNNGYGEVDEVEKGVFIGEVCVGKSGRSASGIGGFFVAKRIFFWAHKRGRIVRFMGDKWEKRVCKIGGKFVFCITKKGVEL